MLSNRDKINKKSLKIGFGSKMDWEAIIFSLLCSLVFTVFLYLLVPVIYCFRNKPLPKAKIKKIIIINAICVWFVFQIIRFSLGETGTSAAVFLWSWVGYKIMIKRLAIENDTSKQQQGNAQPTTTQASSDKASSEKSQESDYVTVCLSREDAPPVRFNNDVPMSDLRIDPSAKESFIPPQQEIPKNNTTEKSINTGRWKKIVNIVIAVALAISLLVIVCLLPLNDDGPLDDYYEERGYRFIYEYNKKIDSGLLEDSGPTFSHFSLAKKITNDSDRYYDYMQEVYKIAANGNSQNNYGKDAVSEYINKLPLDYGEKILLFKFRYTNDNTYNQDIVDYLNEREDISYDTMVLILTELGFTVHDDGYVEWE